MTLRVSDKVGPIYEVVWSPTAKEFVAVYGSMPSKTALFNSKAELIFDYGIASRNAADFSPDGNLLYVGGFGNLPGELDVWDRRTQKKISTFKPTNSTKVAWSPDSRRILTAIQSPRLRVDNGWSLWHLSGVRLHKEEYDELFQVRSLRFFKFYPRA
jgi:translation initiation factor 2A